jgi:hypothetical protein
MKKSGIILIGIILIVISVIFFINNYRDLRIKEEVSDVDNEVVKIINVDWNKYNYKFVDEEVKDILSRDIVGKRIAFYLPPTGYINVSSGSEFGVAFALNNPQSSGENNFKFNWTVDDSVVESCGVGVDEAQSWIARGQMSWGKIGRGWVDHMTVYFVFPENVSCNVKYNFVIWKDGEFYADEILEFNII